MSEALFFAVNLVAATVVGRAIGLAFSRRTVVGLGAAFIVGAAAVLVALPEAWYVALPCSAGFVVGIASATLAPPNKTFDEDR